VRTGVLLLTDVIVVHHVPRPDNSLTMPEVGIVIPAMPAPRQGPACLRRRAAGQLLHSRARAAQHDAETITDRATLLRQFEVIRATGIASEIEEAVIGECGLAAPLVDSSGLNHRRDRDRDPERRVARDSLANDALAQRRVPSRASSAPIGGPAPPPEAHVSVG